MTYEQKSFSHHPFELLFLSGIQHAAPPSNVSAPHHYPKTICLMTIRSALPSYFQLSFSSSS